MPCPFNSDHNVRLAEAWRNLQAGEVDESDFGKAHQGWAAQQVWARMQSFLPFAAEAVVTHGDFSPGNAPISDDGKVSGCIDLRKRSATFLFKERRRRQCRLASLAVSSVSG